MTRILLKSALFTLLASTACKSTSPKENQQCYKSDVLPSQSQNQGGSFGIVDGVTTSNWPAVVLLLRLTADQIEMCTGTFVGHNVVATAGHCVDSSPTGGVSVIRNVLTLNLDDEGRANGPTINSTGVKPLRVVHNGWTKENLVGPDGEVLNVNAIGQDVAYLIMPDNSAPAYLGYYNGTIGADTAGTVVGFGLPSLTSSTPYATKREGNLTVTPAKDIADVLDSEAKWWWLFSKKNASTAPGDSGGPLFIQGQLAGITSSGSKRPFYLGGATISSFANLNSSRNQQLKQQAQAAGAVFQQYSGSASGSVNGIFANNPSQSNTSPQNSDAVINKQNCM